MSLARALVFSPSPRALLAVAAVAASTAYALFAGGSVAGLRGAQEVLQDETFEAGGVYVRPDGAPFFVADAPEGSATLLVHAPGEPTLATMRTGWAWNETTVVPGPLARLQSPPALGADPLYLAPPQYVNGSMGDWVFIPPKLFDAAHPELVGRATLAVGSGPAFMDSPAVDAFYSAGASEIADGLAFVALTSVFVATIVSVVAVRLEVAARRQDFALLESLGAARLVRGLIAARAFVIVALGVLLGATTALAAFAYVNRAQHRLHMEVSAPYLAWTVASIVIVAASLATLAGVRSLRGNLAQNLSRRGLSPRRFPGPWHFIFVTPRIAPVFAVALMATVMTVGVVLGAMDAPRALLDPGGDVEVLAGTTGNPLRGSVPRFAAQVAGRLAQDVVSSPEIYVPTLIGTTPVFVRGVSWPSWVEFTGAHLTTGNALLAPGEAVAGRRLAARLNLEVGDEVRVAGAYRPVLGMFHIVGTVDAPGLERDELLVGLDDAASLAGLDANTVHLARIRNPLELPLPFLETSGIHVGPLHLTPDPPRQGLPANVTFEAINTRAAPAQRLLTLRANGEALATHLVELPAFASTTITFPFRVPASENLTLEVNPTLAREPVAPRLHVQAPTYATMEQGANVTVYGADGFPAEGVTITTPWETTTSRGGTAHVGVQAVGPFSVEAHAGDDFGAARVFGTRQEWIDTFHVEVTSVSIANVHDIDGTQAAFEMLVDVTNFGLQPYQGAIPVSWPGGVGQIATEFQGLSVRRFNVSAAAPYGPVVVAAGSLSYETTLPRPANVPGTGGGDLFTEAMAAKGRPEVVTAEGRTQRFLDDLFAAAGTASLLVVLAAILHGGIVVWTIVRRDATERQGNAWILESLGASVGQARLRAAWDAAVSTLPGIALGLVLTAMAAALANLWGVPRAFGHGIGLSLDGETIFRVGVALVAVAGLAAASAIRPRPPRPTLRTSRPLSEVVR